MYVLEYMENGNKKYNSFENFEFLMTRKQELENNGNTCLVYKMNNNGTEVSRLTDMGLYQVVTDFNKEVRKTWKQYCYLRQYLQEIGLNDFFVDNNILYIMERNNVIEVEKVRTTPRYEVRKNGKVIYDNENAQNEIVKKLFTKKQTIRKKFNKEKSWIESNEIF